MGGLESAPPWFPITVVDVFILMATMAMPSPFIRHSSFVIPTIDHSAASP
jgi:hypothetical protein